MGVGDSGGEMLPDEWFQEHVAAIPKDSRPAFFAAVSARAGEGEQKSLFQAMAERFGRQSANMIQGAGAAVRIRELDELARVTVAIDGAPDLSGEGYGFDVGGYTLNAAASPQGSAMVSAAKVPAIGSPEFSALSPEKQAALTRIDKERDYTTLHRQISDFAFGAVDPAEGKTFYAKGLLGVASSAPNIALTMAGPVGIALNVGAYQNEAFLDFNERNPGASMESAVAYSATTGLLQGLVDIIPAKVLTGRLPALNKITNMATVTGGSIALRGAARGFAGFTGEVATEVGQDVVFPAAIEAIIAAVDSDVSNFGIRERFDIFTSDESMSELIPSFLMMTLIGVGVGGVRDYKDAVRSMGNYDMLKAHGIGEAEASNIIADMRAGNLKGAETAFRREYEKAGLDQKSLREAQAEAIPRIIEEREKIREAVKKGQDLNLLPVIVHDRGGKWSLRFKDGESVTFDSYGEASARMGQHISDSVLDLHADPVSTIQQISKGIESERGLRYLFGPDRPTVRDNVVSGVSTEAEAMEDINLAERLSPQIIQEFEEASAAAGVVAKSAEERQMNTQIIGSSVNAEEFADRVQVTTMRLFQGFTTATVVEEKAEGDAKVMIGRNGQRKWMLGALRQWDQLTGDDLIVSDDDTQIKNKEIVEAWSKMVVSYFTGSGTTGARMQAMMETELAGPLTSYSALFRSVIKRAAMIEKAKADGTFDGDLETFLAQSVGMSEGAQFERGVIAEGEAIAGEMGAVSSNLAGPLTDSRATPADTSNVTQLPDGSQLVGPTTFSILAWHGTPHKVGKFSLDKIGTGEGAQAYGWGLYFAGGRGTAKWYQETLSKNNLRLGGVAYSELDSWGKGALESIGRLRNQNYSRGLVGETIIKEAEQGVKIAEGNLEEAKAKLGTTENVGNSGEPATFTWTQEAIDETEDNLLILKRSLERWQAVDFGDLYREGDYTRDEGNLYGVELMPDEADFLDWDKPLSEQSEKVQAALGGISVSPIDGKAIEEMNGKYFYRMTLGNLAEKHGVDGAAKAASEYLASIGIPGIRYLDGNSRSGGEGTSNYVIFDESLVKIIEENGQKMEGETTFSVLTRVIDPGSYSNSLDAVVKSTTVSSLRKAALRPSDDLVSLAPELGDMTLVSPAYRNAKKLGDGNSAYEVVKSTVKNDAIERLRGLLDSEKPVVFVPVVHQDTGKRANAIPRAYAEVLASRITGAVDEQIVKISGNSNTRATTKGRMRNAQAFDGAVLPNVQYVVVDDVFTSGSTITALIDHIIGNGGTVAAATSLAAGQSQNYLRPRPQDVNKLLDRAKVSGVEFERELGFPVTRLTGSEIYRLANLERGWRGVSFLKERFLDGSGVPEGGIQADRGRGKGVDSSGFQSPEGLGETTFSILPEVVARHTELEAKHNAGTITPAETAEAQGMVDDAAKGAGFNQEGWHYSERKFKSFDLGFARTSAEIQGFFFKDRKDDYKEYGRNEYHVFIKLLLGICFFIPSVPFPPKARGRRGFTPQLMSYLQRRRPPEQHHPRQTECTSRVQELMTEKEQSDSMGRRVTLSCFLRRTSTGI